MSSSILIYIEGPAAAIALRSDLICCWSIATLACIWYIDFLPPTLFGVSCRSNFWDVWFGKSGLWHCGVGINLKFQWYFHYTLQVFFFGDCLGKTLQVFLFWDCLGKNTILFVWKFWGGHDWILLLLPSFLWHPVELTTICVANFLTAGPWMEDGNLMMCPQRNGTNFDCDPVLATMVYRCQCSSSKSFGCVRTGAEATFTVVNFTMNVGLLTLPCLFAQHGWSTGATEWVDTRTATGKTRNPRSNTAELWWPLCILCA